MKRCGVFKFVPVGTTLFVTDLKLIPVTKATIYIFLLHRQFFFSKTSVFVVELVGKVKLCKSLRNWD